MNVEAALRIIMRQNDLILNYLKIDLEVDDQQLRRTAIMARKMEEVVGAIEQETDLIKALKIQSDHTLDVFDEIAADVTALKQQLKDAGVDQGTIDALYDKVVSNRTELSSMKDHMAEVTVKNTPFDPSAH